jgi:hypothetical protein
VKAFMHMSHFTRHHGTNDVAETITNSIISYPESRYYMTLRKIQDAGI